MKLAQLCPTCSFVNVVGAHTFYIYFNCFYCI